MRASTSLKLLTASVLTGALTATAFAHEIDKDRDNLTTHDLSGFTEISVAGVYKLDVKVGDDFSVTTSGPDKEVENMEVSVKNGVLVLGSKKENKKWNRGSRNGIYAVVTMPKLDAMDVAGIATGHVDDIDSDDMEINVAGIADLALSGKCGSLELDVAGMGEVDAKELKCENVTVDMAGMGQATVYASDSVDADAAGMGQIDVYGSPKNVDKSKSFMSSVDIK